VTVKSVLLRPGRRGDFMNSTHQNFDQIFFFFLATPFFFWIFILKGEDRQLSTYS
jgi:hypothetical protein